MRRSSTLLIASMWSKTETRCSNFIGFGVCQFLETNFKQFIDYNFTVRMEEDLDKIAQGELKKETFLEEFYLGESGLMEQNKRQLNLDNKGESKTLNLCHIDEANPIMIGPYGPYVVLEDGQLVSLPHECTPAGLMPIKELIANGKQQAEVKTLGPCPNTGEPIQLHRPFRPYWQEGRQGRQTGVDTRGFRMATCKRTAPSRLAIEPASILGKDKDGVEVVATKGKYGPYISRGDTTRRLNRLDKDRQLFSITLEEALELLGKEEVKGSTKRGSRSAPAPLKELGELNGRKITLQSGRYGFYLKHGESNVALPNEYKKDEEKALSLRPEEARRIVEEKQST